jgi:hypothetical protein
MEKHGKTKGKQNVKENLITRELLGKVGLEA